MNAPFDSVYPDLLRTGLSKLGLLSGHRELLALFSALEHFRRDLHAQNSAAGILQVSQRYVAGLSLFRTTGFWLVNPADFSFELTLAAPDLERAVLAQIVDQEIHNGRFAWALRQNAPFFFQAGSKDNPERCLLHSLALSNQVVGMFCGRLHRELSPNQEITFSLLSLLLGAGADALAALRKTAQLTNQIETLSGLLPLCAWCKKVRNDSGYWEQIEQYITTRSDASFTHGVCPDCRKKLLGDLAKA
jgi:hypothetical protein